MPRGILITILVLAGLLAFGLWAYYRSLTRDTSISISDGSSGGEISGRILVWSTEVNVPFRYVGSKDENRGRGFLESIGIPKKYRFVEYYVARVPVRDEWNLAMTLLAEGVTETEPSYLTFDQGTYLHSVISADGSYIVATMVVDEAQNVVRFDTDTGYGGVVSFSTSKDRWPSCTSDGSQVLFHSWRDQNPGGDLYLAIEDGNEDDGWRTVRMTDNPEVEYVWPSISADGHSCISVVRDIGSIAGRIDVWEIENEILGEPQQLTDDEEHVMFPSMSGTGDMCCWLEYRSKWDIMTWDGIEVDYISLPDYGTDWAYEINQPRITADGKHIVFIRDYEEVGADLIGIYSVENRDVIYFEGSEGSVIFPSMSDPIEGGDQ